MEAQTKLMKSNWRVHKREPIVLDWAVISNQTLLK